MEYVAKNYLLNLVVINVLQSFVKH